MSQSTNNTHKLMNTKRPFKTFAAILACAALLLACLAPPAKAQNIQYVTSAATVPASLSNVVNTSIPVAYSKDVAVGINFQLMAAGTSPILFNFDTSNDNVNWISNSHGFLLTAAGTAQINYLTNWTLNGIPFMRLGRVFNTNANIVTNLTITAVTKRGL